jgi:hypothetical protein
MTRGYVRRIDAEALQQALRDLKPGEYLWQEDYPGRQELQKEPLDPAKLPAAGRIIAPEFELRFFNGGGRGVLLSEERFEPALPGDEEYGAAERKPKIPAPSKKPVHNGARDWCFSFYEYTDAIGRVAWVRWRAEKSGGQDA